MTRKQGVMSFIFLDVIIAGAICGYMCHKYCMGNGTEIVAGSTLALVSMFCGMVLAFMVSDDRERGKRMKAEHDFQMKLQQIVATERMTCAKVSLNMTRVVVDRVVNKVLSRFVEGMSDDDRRKAILDVVEAIIQEETGTLHKVLKDEIGV